MTWGPMNVKSPRYFYVPELDLQIRADTEPALRLSVVYIERLGPFCGYHIYLDNEWMNRDRREAMHKLATAVGVKSDDLGQWLIEHFPACQWTPESKGSVDLREVIPLTVWDFEEWQKAKYAERGEQ